MRREHMEDMARLYAPAAARAIRNEQWELAAALLLERCQTLDMALQSLTPGGSEYVGDPERCVEFAKSFKADAHAYRLQQARTPKHGPSCPCTNCT